MDSSSLCSVLVYSSTWVVWFIAAYDMNEEALCLHVDLRSSQQQATNRWGHYAEADSGGGWWLEEMGCGP